MTFEEFRVRLTEALPRTSDLSDPMRLKLERHDGEKGENIRLQWYADQSSRADEPDFAKLTLLSKLFDTLKINVNEWEHEGCDTCSNGWRTGHVIDIREIGNKEAIQHIRTWSFANDQRGDWIYRFPPGKAKPSAAS